METFVLFYSNYCANCKEFIQQLYKTQFFEKFKKVCVDNNPKVPPQISSIPTIIVPRMMKPLVGTEAFHWLRGMNQLHLREEENKINSSASNQAQNGQVKAEGQSSDPTNLSYAMGAVTAYSGTMGGFSDNFSFIGSENPQEHSFSFLGNNNNGKIYTPQENGDDPRSSMESGSKKNDMDKDFEKLMAMRANDIPKPISRQ